MITMMARHNKEVMRRLFNDLLQRAVKQTARPMKKRLGATSGGIKNCASLGRRASTRPAVSTHEVQCALSYSERHPVKAVWPSDVLMVRQSMEKEGKLRKVGWRGEYLCLR
jgi:ABC-type iron transport system FetAB ATPase subunit